MASEREIVEFLIARHDPAAIILVGSRADGLARPGCDWDLYVLVRPTETRVDRVVPAPAVFADEQLDIGLVQLPIADEKLLALFGPNLQQARVLLDDDRQVAATLCERALQLYARGRGLTDTELDLREHELARNLARMRARSDQPGAFFEAALYFFHHAHRSWFEVLHDRWSLSV
ncbi:MAG: nucleotidyltransferase domain-containing protein, partial [Myxococcota bacterium]